MGAAVHGGSGREIDLFSLARRGCRAVGMCSVSRCFSTFTCRDIGLLDDFFIEPVSDSQGEPGC